MWSILWFFSPLEILFFPRFNLAEKIILKAYLSGLLHIPIQCSDACSLWSHPKQPNTQYLATDAWRSAGCMHIKNNSSGMFSFSAWYHLKIVITKGVLGEIRTTTRKRGGNEIPVMRAAAHCSAKKWKTLWWWVQ